MTQRTADVQVTANVRGALAGFEQLRTKVQSTSKDMMKSAQENEQAWNQVGGSALAIGALAGAGIALAVSKFAEFDKAISAVQASTRASAGDMGLLRDAALQAGADTVFTATEAANAIDELAKAGITTADILGGGLSGALSLASAGSLGVAEAASIAATAMTQFRLSGTDVGHIADLLAAGAGKAQGSVQDLSAALNQGGLVASQTGLSIEETTATLASFASAGLLGSDAGTSFKTMLQRLTPQSKEAKEKMDELGISAYDAKGQFVGMQQFAGNLQAALKDLTPEARNAALGVMFGSDAVRAASVIYNQGAEGIASWTEKVNDAGYAAETARLKLDNLAGDIEKLGGSFDTALIKSGSAANDVLRNIVQSATGAIDAFGAMPQPVQGTALTIGALVAGVGILAGSFMMIVPKIAATRAAMESLNISGISLAKGIGKGGAVLYALQALTSGISEVGQKAELSADQIANINSMFDLKAIGNYSEKVNELSLTSGDFQRTLKGFFSGNFFESNRGGQALFGAIDKFTMGFTHLNDYAQTTDAYFGQMSKRLSQLATIDFKEATSAFHDFVVQTDGSNAAIENLLSAFPEYKAQLIGIAAEQGKTNLTTQDYIDLAQGEGPIAQQAFRDATAKSEFALKGFGAAAVDSSGKLAKLADQIRGFGSVTLDANSAARNLEQAIDDATAKFKENGATLDITSEKGRANSAALDAIAKAAAESAAANWTLNGSESELQAGLATSRQSLVDTALQFGMSKDEAQKYADKVLATPEQVMTQVKLSGIPESKKELSDLRADIESVPDTKVTKWEVLMSTPKDFPDWLKSNDNRDFPFTVTKREFGSENGNMFSYQAFADGGFPTGIYAGRAGAIHKFAEPNTRWEAYISGKPGQEKRNIGIANEALARLGGSNPGYASVSGSAGGGGNSYNSSGDTFNASFSLIPQSGIPVADQAFNAARRLKARQKVRR